MDLRRQKKYKDTILNFNKEYIKTEIFPRELGKKIAGAEEIRHASDYDDFYIATVEESKEQIAVAEEVIKRLEKYCTEKIDKKRWNTWVLHSGIFIITNYKHGKSICFYTVGAR